MAFSNANNYHRALKRERERERERKRERRSNKPVQKAITVTGTHNVS